MKRIFSVFLTAIIVFSFASCGKKINFESDIKKLESIGFNSVKTAESEDELSELTETFNFKIASDHGKFEVKITGYQTFNKTSEDDYFSCQFIEFESETQAKNYFDFYISSRLESSDYKLKIYENKIILTNSEEAMKALQGKFE